MYNQYDIKNIISVLKNCFQCEVNVWENESVLFSTSDHCTFKPAKWLSFQEVYNVQSPIIIFSPRNHRFCTLCSELNNCKLELELFFPFADNSGGVNMQFDKRAKEVLAAIDINHLMHLLKNYALYINLLLDRKNILKQNMLLTQHINYLSNLVPEGIAFFNQHKELARINSTAKQLNLPELLADHENTQPTILNELGRKTNINFTIAHAKGDIPIQGKSFFYNKEFTGALIHTKRQMHQEKDISKPQKQSTLSKIITRDQTILKILDIVQQVAKSDSTVLIRGESGTGKEMVAQAIYELSNRSTGPFIAINCAAIPEHLLESELFGYEEGAFTGAKKGGKLGKIELANNGTLFLDEVGDMPLALQVKMLRVIQEKTIDRIGGTKPIPVDIRLVTATNRNLEEMIAQGTFREDLFFRLNVIPIHIPPLRERPNDIEILLNYFLKKYCVTLNKNFKVFSYAARQQLLSYQWPGNIRELENIIEYLVNIHDKNVITPEDLSVKFNRTPAADTRDKNANDKINTANYQRPSKSEQVREEIINLLNIYGWHTKGKKRVAENLDISLATLYRWIKKYKIKE